MAIRIGKLGIVRLTKEDLVELRRKCFERDKVCVNCGRSVIWEAGLWKSGHMAHIIGRGRGGSDTLENVRLLCFACHLIGDHNPKSVPPKR